ncbi:Ribosomal RNA small subunit methyltransferase G [Gammaproteobacteria bacterium]
MITIQQSSLSLKLLRSGSKELALDLSEVTLESLLHYLNLLLHWNRVYNLTAINDPMEIVIKHLLDSLAVISHLPPGQMLDVGSGAGLPAIPLALAIPGLQVTALDSNQKKVRFITQVALELGIKNLTVVHQRVENYSPKILYDVIIARAFAKVSEFVAATFHLLVPGGQWLAMKGTRPDAELMTLPVGCRLKEVIPLRVPNLEAERHLVALVAIP